jgi:hypothetical protein
MIGIVYFRNVKNDLELLLLDDTIQSMPCLLPKQPLYYLITEDSPEHISIIENQLFSKSMALVYKLQKTKSHQWTISNKTKISFHDRRSNHGQTLQVVSDSILPYFKISNYGTLKLVTMEKLQHQLYHISM